MYGARMKLVLQILYIVNQCCILTVSGVQMCRLLSSELALILTGEAAIILSPGAAFIVSPVLMDCGLRQQ